MKKVIGRWIVLAIAVPILAAALGSVADTIEKRRGSDSKAVRGVRAVRGVVRKAA